MPSLRRSSLPLNNYLGQLEIESLKSHTYSEVHYWAGLRETYWQDRFYLYL